MTQSQTPQRPKSPTEAIAARTGRGWRWLREPLLARFRKSAAHEGLSPLAQGARAALAAQKTLARRAPASFGGWFGAVWVAKFFSYLLAAFAFLVFAGMGMAAFAVGKDYAGLGPQGWVALAALAFGATGALDGLLTASLLKGVLRNRLPRLPEAALRRGLTWGMALAYPFCLLIYWEKTRSGPPPYPALLPESIALFSLLFGLVAGGGLGWALHRAARTWKAFVYPMLGMAAGAFGACLPMASRDTYGFLVLSILFFPSLPLALALWALFRKNGQL